MRSVARIAAALLAGALGHAAAQGMPPPGVYACYEVKATFGQPGCIQSNIGCMGMSITPAPVMMFGLIDGASYSDYDGHRGKYSYDPAAGVLTMADGSRQGWKYQHLDDWSFRALDQQGHETSFTCPLDPKKDPLKRPW